MFSQLFLHIFNVSLIKDALLLVWNKMSAQQTAFVIQGCLSGLFLHQMGMLVVTHALSAAPYSGQGFLEIWRLSNARSKYSTFLLF